MLPSSDSTWLHSSLQPSLLADTRSCCSSAHPNPTQIFKPPARQLDRLRQLPYLDKILDIPLVRSLLLGLLPGLALRLFVMLLPLLLYPLNRASGAISKADVDFQVSTQYFVFQVLCVFIASFISGAGRGRGVFFSWGGGE